MQLLMKNEGLPLRSIPAVPLEKLGVSGTPTLQLVDRDGRVLAWAKDRCRYRGMEGMRRWVGLIADNVINLGHRLVPQMT